MKTSELEKLLKENGCELVRHGSNHDIWISHINNKQFPIPRHKGEVKKRTANGILRQAGIE